MCVVQLCVCKLKLYRVTPTPASGCLWVVSLRHTERDGDIYTGAYHHSGAAVFVLLGTLPKDSGHNKKAFTYSYRRRTRLEVPLLRRAALRVISPAYHPPDATVFVFLPLHTLGRFKRTVDATKKPSPTQRRRHTQLEVPLLRGALG